MFPVSSNDTTVFPQTGQKSRCYLGPRISSHPHPIHSQAAATHVVLLGLSNVTHTHVQLLSTFVHTFSALTVYSMITCQYFFVYLFLLIILLQTQINSKLYHILVIKETPPLMLSLNLTNIPRISSSLNNFGVILIVQSHLFCEDVSGIIMCKSTPLPPWASFSCCLCTQSITAARRPLSLMRFVHVLTCVCVLQIVISSRRRPQLIFKIPLLLSPLRTQHIPQHLNTCWTDE